jgi:hypothetical protein
MYLELTKTMSTEEFLSTFKRFVARKGRPLKVYSDNAKTFVAGAKWIKQVMKDEKFNDFLAKMSIKWQFNMSRAPWWGGQYERLIGLVKQAMYKSIGNGFLSWTELEDVILDMEVTLNNRPLSYVEEDANCPYLHRIRCNSADQTYYQNNQSIKSRIPISAREQSISGDVRTCCGKDGRFLVFFPSLFKLNKRSSICLRRDSYQLPITLSPTTSQKRFFVFGHNCACNFGQVFSTRQG